MENHYLSGIFKGAKIERLRESKSNNFGIDQIELKDAKYSLLVTDGMRHLQQTVNTDNADLERIELCFCLPDYFNLSVKSWPIDWLERIAAIPQKNNTWFGHGDTIPAGNPPQEVDEQFKANHFILRRPHFLNQTLHPDKLDGFSFLAVIPIFQRELDYKLKNSHTMLFNLFDKKQVTEYVDIYREDVRKKRFGLF